MEYRTWITEALRLHFEEHLPRIVAGRRLGVPKSTDCGMFVRFRKAGLSWPLPAGMSERELDARLYGSASTVPVVLTENTVMSEVPVVKKRPRRPNFPYEFKIALVEQSLQPGACVAQIARVMSSTTQIPCCLSFRTKPGNKNVGSGQMLIRFPPGYIGTVNKMMAIYC